MKWAAALLLAAAAPVVQAQDLRARPAAGETIYFLLPDRFDNGDTANDRGGLQGGRLQTGFDPAAKGFYHGGDLKGLIRRLDYLQGLGATAVWVGPVFRNKPVQGPPGQESAGYHGYWITDFTRVDPHFGTNAEFKALAMPTFLGNHDMGRFSTLVRQERPGISAAELEARVALAHVMLLTLRGAPVIYSGDEQGFVGDGNDQDARKDMFAGHVASYSDNQLIAATRPASADHFDPAHPFYRLIARLAALRQAHPALARGRQVVRGYAEKPGLFSVSRFDPATSAEYLIAFNTSDAAIHAASVIGTKAETLETLFGACQARVSAPGSVMLDLPAFGSAVCRVHFSSPGTQSRP